MPAIGQDITHYAGDTLTITIGPVLDNSGLPVDLNGATARWWMAKSNKATGTDIYLKKSTSPGAMTIDRVTTDEWSITIPLVPADTDLAVSGIKDGNYYHECEVVDADGNISTVCLGKFVLKPTLIPDVL